MKKGFALVTVLILSFLALLLIAVLLFMVSRSSQMSGMEKRYTSSLEVAKGVSTYLMELMEEDALCSKTDCSQKNVPIDLGNYSAFGPYRAKAILLSRVSPGPNIWVYAIEVTVVNENNPSEKSIVDFVYEVSP